MKKHWRICAHILLIFLLLTPLLSAAHNKPEEDFITSQSLTFVGEYSQNGGAWQTLTEDTRLSALKGELVLRGHFDRAIPDGQSLHLYLDHLEYCLYINGDVMASSEAWNWKLTTRNCASTWDSIDVPAITTQDTVELHLRNHHRYGNTTAYMSLLDSFYTGHRSALQETLSPQNRVMWVVGTLVAILSTGVLGIALAFSLSRIPNTYRLLSLGLVSLFVGIYMCLDTADISLRLPMPSLISGARLLCLMLGALELNIFLSRALSEKGQRVATIALYVHSAFDVALVLVSLTGKVLLYDLMMYWAMLQVILCIVLLVCCFYEIQLRRKLRSMSLLASLFLLGSGLMELVGNLFVAFPGGWVFKIVYLIFFVLLLIRNIRYIAANHQKTERVNELATELENNRILLAMNQIRTHFIFNVLNAISGMCKYDPAKADRTVVLFARFLRTNIDIMQSDTPVTFNMALRHVEDYITLEQIRFGDKLNFVTDIEEDYFCLPPLVLQPLVENAIKHGLTSKPNGGTITLRTWLEDNDVCLSVHDDGVGYDTTQPVRDGSVGLQNVRFRLQHIMHATLTIDSTVGEGTTATIRIPLEEATKCM